MNNNNNIVSRLGLGIVGSGLCSSLHKPDYSWVGAQNIVAQSWQ